MLKYQELIVQIKKSKLILSKNNIEINYNWKMLIIMIKN